MRRISLAVVLVAAAVGAVMVTATAAPAAAATNNTTATDNGTGPSHDVVSRIDGAAYVSAAEWSNGTMHLTIVSDTYRSATVSGTVGGDGEGGGTFAIHGVTLYDGVTNVSVAAPRVDGVATATITTSRCIEAGRCGYVQVGAHSDAQLLTGGSAVGWLGGSITAVIAALVTAILVVRRESNGPEKV